MENVAIGTQDWRDWKDAWDGFGSHLAPTKTKPYKYRIADTGRIPDALKHPLARCESLSSLSMYSVFSHLAPASSTSPNHQNTSPLTATAWHGNVAAGSRFQTPVVHGPQSIRSFWVSTPGHRQIHIANPGRDSHTVLQSDPARQGSV